MASLGSAARPPPLGSVSSPTNKSSKTVTSPSQAAANAGFVNNRSPRGGKPANLSISTAAPATAASSSSAAAAASSAAAATASSDSDANRKVGGVHLTKEEEAEFREIFNLVDRDGGGSISKQELGQLMDTLGIHATEVSNRVNQSHTENVAPRLFKLILLMVCCLFCLALG